MSKSLISYLPLYLSHWDFIHLYKFLIISLCILYLLASLNLSISTWNNFHFLVHKLIIHFSHLWIQAYRLQLVCLRVKNCMLTNVSSSSTSCRMLIVEQCSQSTAFFTGLWWSNFLNTFHPLLLSFNYRLTDGEYIQFGPCIITLTIC